MSMLRACVRGKKMTKDQTPTGASVNVRRSPDCEMVRISSDGTFVYTENKAHQWVSVSERLPTHDAPVLGTDGEHQEIVCCINAPPEWVSRSGDYGDFMHILNVTQ